MSATQVLEQIHKLSFEEQCEILEQLRVELELDLTPEQAAELDRRLAEFEKNPHDGVPWEQVEADLNKRFGWQ